MSIILFIPVGRFVRAHKDEMTGTDPQCCHQSFMKDIHKGANETTDDVSVECGKSGGRRGVDVRMRP